MNINLINAATFILVISSILAVVGCEKQTQITNPCGFDTSKTACYFDSISRTTVTVSNDKRKLTATSEAHDTLWIVDPFDNAKLELYRTNDPKIIYISEPSDWIKESIGDSPAVEICYNSSQFGVVDLRTGVFRFLGQD